MRKYFMLLFLFFSFCVYGGDQNIIYHGSFVENSNTFIFGDNARVRKIPEIAETNIADTLPAGFPVKILKKTSRVMSQNGFSEYWYQISYMKNEKKVTGYIWGGLIAAGYQKTDKDLLIFGFRKYAANGGFEGECRLIHDGKIISSLPVTLHDFPSGGENPFYVYNITVNFHNNLGLSGLKHIISINCNYEACGYPAGNIWIGISDEKLYYLGTDTSVFEAGVFHYEEEMIFPSSDKSLKDEIRLVGITSNFDENIQDYRQSDKKVKRFKWINFRMEEQK